MKNLKRSEAIKFLLEAEEAVSFHVSKVQTFLYGEDRKRHVVRDCLKQDNQIIFEVIETDENNYDDCSKLTEAFVKRYTTGILIDYLKAKSIVIGVKK